MAAGVLAGSLASGAAAGAMPATAPASAPMRHTTRALRAARPLLSLSELGALYALIDAGLSYETGVGIVSYSRWASVARISRRQAMRYGVRFAARGIIVAKHRFWNTVRPAGDMNRANEYFLPILSLLDEPGEDLTPEAYRADEADQADDSEPATDNASPVALDASEAAPPPIPADTRPRAVKAAAPAAAVSSCSPSSVPPSSGSTSAVPADEVACVLGALQLIEELQSIATEGAAVRITKVARKNGKTLATVRQALADAADKAAGRTGPVLEAHVVSYVRAARAVVEAAPPPSLEEKKRRREDKEATQRRLEELGEADRQRKLRAVEALRAQRGPP